MGPTNQSMAAKTMQHKNVAGGQLRFFSDNPLTGHYRDGYCRSGPEDPGNHSVAATMTQGFLDFTAAKGNNLKDKGITNGMNWCLCAHRWQEAMQAVESGELGQDAVPRVYLHASDKSALDTVSYKDMKKYSIQTAVDSHRQGADQDPASEHSITKESKDIGGDQPTEAPGAGKNQSNKGQIVNADSSRG